MERTRILVSGLVNVETVLPVEGFPLPYCPITYPEHAVRTAPSGVALNIACALAALGEAPRVLSLTASDGLADLIRAEFVARGLDSAGLAPGLGATPQSVVLHDSAGRRRIFCDLTDTQRTPLPDPVVDGAWTPLPALAILCNINFSRPLLARARAAGVPIATDLHVFTNPDDSYNADFLRAADILFMSHEGLPCAPGDFFGALRERSPARVMVITMGGDGAMLHDRRTGATLHLPAVHTRPVRDTVGAGDASLAAFCHHTLRGDSPETALRKAMVFASWKIGESGGAQGFPDAAQYARLLDSAGLAPYG